MSKITQQKKAAKKINEILPKVTHISVVDYVDEYITSYADPDDEWGRDSTAQSHSIQGISIHPNYGDLDVSFDVLPNQTYYLLYYLYETGDSFGSDSGRIEFVCLYNDQTLAEKSCASMNKFNRNDRNKQGHVNPVTIWNDLGQPYQEHINDDYFGGFEVAGVISVQLI
jgi:hypothetical protein